jgi:nucleoside-diphosphate-sugar epimerase
MKIFLTGGTGFIGSHFVNKAHEAGHELVCLLHPGSHTRIPIESEPIWVEGSMEDDWSEEMSNCEVLVHLAAHSTNVPYDTLENCLYWNVTVSLQLLQAARIAGIRKFIIVGTGFEYGLSGDDYEFIPIDAPLKPTMSYPASKAAASIVFSQWAIECKLKLKYLRIFQVFGEGEEENRLWPSMKKAAFAGDDYNLTSGEQVRDFTPVEEVAKQLVDNLQFFDINAGEPQTKHIGTDKPQSIKQFANYWWLKWGAKGELNFGANLYRDNEVMRFVPSI